MIAVFAIKVTTKIWLKTNSTCENYTKCVGCKFSTTKDHFNIFLHSYITPILLSVCLYRFNAV